MNALYKVKDDLFHIAKRLKEIDARYELYFNRAKGRFEVYANGAMQLALPFDRLDNRTLIHVRETRLERFENLIEEIECNNTILDNNLQRASFERNLAKTEALL